VTIAYEWIGEFANAERSHHEDGLSAAAFGEPGAQRVRARCPAFVRAGSAGWWTDLPLELSTVVLKAIWITMLANPGT
jgi:hypothetical protein